MPPKRGAKVLKWKLPLQPLTSLELTLYRQQLTDFHGPLVEQVITALLPSPLPLLPLQRAVAPAVKSTDTRAALRIALQHGFVKMKQVNGGIVYSVDTERIQSPRHYAVWVVMMKRQFGTLAELLLELLLVLGEAQRDFLVTSVCSRCQAAAHKSVKEEPSTKRARVDHSQSEVGATFDRLLEANIIEEMANPVLELDPDKESPVLDAARETELRNGASAAPYFRANHSELGRLRLRRLLHEALLYRYGAPVTPILDLLARGQQTRQKLTAASPSGSEWVQILQDEGAVRLESEAGGGVFTLADTNLLHDLALAELKSALRERFGDRALRVWSIVQANGLMEQRDIEQRALVSSRDGKELLYRLLHAGLIVSHPLSKTLDYLPSRSTYLFYIDSKQVCERVFRWTTQTLLHLTERHQLETTAGAKIIIKEARLKELLGEATTEEEREQLSKLLNTADHEQLRRHKRRVARLVTASTRVTATHTLLQNALLYGVFDKERI